MAIIACPKCGRSISDKAVKCVHCGEALIKESAQSQMEYINSVGEDTVVAQTETPVIETDNTNYRDKFLKESPRLAAFLKKSDKAFAIHKKVRFLFWLFWQAIFALLIFLFYKDGEATIAEIYLPLMLGLLMLAVIMFLNAWFEYFPSSKFVSECIRWLKNGNYDVDGFINRECQAFIKLGDSDAITELFDFTSAWYYSKHEEDYKIARLHLRIRMIIGIVFLVGLVFVLPFVVAGIFVLDYGATEIIITVVILAVMVIVYIATFFIWTARDYKQVRSVYKDVD